MFGNHLLININVNTCRRVDQLECQDCVTWNLVQTNVLDYRNQILVINKFFEVNNVFKWPVFVHWLCSCNWKKALYINVVNIINKQKWLLLYLLVEHEVLGMARTEIYPPMAATRWSCRLGCHRNRRNKWSPSHRLTHFWCTLWT